jgi:uncharacterized membrane protein
MMRGAFARLRSDDGSTLLLTIFYAALALTLILLVTAATSLYVERKRLFTVADDAALVGAESFKLSGITDNGGRIHAQLTSPAVAEAVTGYLAAHPPDSSSPIAVDRAGTVDGRSATVQLSEWWSPPVLSLLVPRGFRLSVTSVARSVFS